MMNKDIAIIGMAGKFPEAANVYEFYKNLKAGRDSVREVDEKRIKDTALPVDIDYQILGYLDDIDKFDHKFFNISFVEAQNMDPQQRLMLEVAYETFESAGYNIDHFNNSKTAVYVSGAEYQYQKMVDIFEPTAFSGNTHYTTAGRIARAFHLRGPAAVTDTGCSGSLVAVHMACNEIWLGNVDYALACGTRLIAFPALKKLYIDVGITSKDGKTKSFADDSYGSGSCETVGAILLKPLEKALEDKDTIYAVIKGAAMNQNGQHAGSLTATSSIAQAEVLETAWKKANVDPLTISYIEAHGSGTQLGDPIEISGIDMAFKKYTDKKNFVAVSSVKTNIGHTDTAAGMAGIVKAALSVHNKELFPSLHFEKPNPFIDFKNSVVYINTELKKWEVPAEIGIRRAGVNSFGFAGNNTHVVLEEAIPVENETVSSEESRDYLFTFSSKTKNGLAGNIGAFTSFIKENSTISLKDISYTLTKGRKHYDQRFVCTAASIDELLKKLSEDKSEQEIMEIKKMVFLFSPDSIVTKDLINFLRKYQVFEESFKQCEKIANNSSPAFLRFSFQYSFYKLLHSFGITTDNVLGVGTGELVVSAVLGESTLEESIQSALSAKEEIPLDLSEKLYNLVERETESEKVLFFEMGPEGIISKEISMLEWPNKEEFFEVLSLNASGNLNEVLQTLYTNKINLDWNKIDINSSGKKIYLPTYQFEKTRCWLDPYKGKEPYAAYHPAYYLATLVDPNITKSKIVATENVAANVVMNNTSVNVEVEDSWTETQKKVAKIWGQVLKLDKMGLDDDFFRLGGHSLFGVQVTNRIEKEFQIRLQFKDIVTFSTIRLLSHGIENLLKQKAEGGIAFVSIPNIEKSEYYEVSNSQRRLWMVDQLEEDTTSLAYNLPNAVLIEGDLDKVKLENVFQTLIDRHEILRTSFETLNGEPVQKVDDDIDFKIECDECTESELDSKINSFIRPFDLSIFPLMRVGLIKLSAKKHALILDMHHIISDGSSMALMIKEFFALYDNQILPENKIQYKDYAAWQKKFMESEQIKEQEQFWLKEFEDEVPVLNLPADFSRPAVQSFEGEELHFKLTKELSEKIRMLAKDSGTTLYMLMLAAYNVLLSKYSGDEDIVVGSPTAGRSHADLENMLGIFINTLAYRNQPKAEKTFDTFLSEVRSKCFSVYQNQDYPFENLVNNLSLQRDMSRNPVFDVMFLFQNAVFTGENNINGLTFEGYHFDRKASQFDLTLEVKDVPNSIEMRIEYCTRLFKHTTIERFKHHFINILKRIVENPSASISEISVMDEKELLKIKKFNDSVQPNIHGSTTVSELISKIAKTHASQTALIAEKEFSFEQLNKEANKVANYLREKIKVKNDDVVALIADRSSETIIALLGIIKSGAAYLPIDPEYPQERIELMLKDSGCKVVLTNANVNLPGFKGKVLLIKEALKGSPSEPPIVNKPEDLLYVIYTSGSTGTPKGVMVEHKNLVSFSQNLKNNFGIEQGQKVLASTNLTFDISGLEILSALINGNTIVLANNEELQEPALLLQLIENKNVEVVQFTPSRLKLLLQSNGKQTLGKLKTILVGGEALTENLKEDLLSLSISNSINVYGPTETTIWSTSWKINEENVLIGKPLQNEFVHILSDNNVPQAIGIFGEICIAGEGVARGYINNENLTPEKFVVLSSGERVYKTGDLGRWNTAGEIEFGGRKDNQVKVRGYRVELGEVENAIAKQKGIKDVAVVAVDNPFGDKELIAYVVGKTDSSLLKNKVRSLLPDYMIPSQFIVVEDIHLTSSGKIDRKKMQAVNGTAIPAAFIAPSNPVEEKLCALFGKVLNQDKIGVTDNFFELGGHSLKASILVAAIESEINTKLALRDIFKFPSVRELAGHIKQKETSSSLKLEKAPSSAYYPLSFGQKRLYVLQQFEEASTIYNLPGALEVKGELDIKKLTNVFRTIIQRHESLRTGFKLVNGEPIQFISEQVDFNVPVIDMTGKSAKEIQAFVNSQVAPFDLSKTPLLRVSVIKLSGDKHIIFHDMNHIVSDGTSMSILVSEFIELYKGNELSPLKLQFKDYAVWQNKFMESPEMTEQQKFWKSYLSDVTPTDIPADFVRSENKNFEGDRVSALILPEAFSGIKAISKQTGATNFMVMLAVYNILLNKLSGSKDITVGTPVAGRPHSDVQNNIGMFVNTIALRNQLRGNLTFIDLVLEVKASVLEALENQDYPFEKVVETLGTKAENRNPLFDTVLVYQNMDFSNEAIGTLEFKQYPLQINTSKFDITWEIMEANNQLQLNVEYNSSLFRRSTIEQFINDLQMILTTAITEKNIKIEDIELSLTANTVDSGSVKDFDFEF